MRRGPHRLSGRLATSLRARLARRRYIRSEIEIGVPPAGFEPATLGLKDCPGSVRGRASSSDVSSKLLLLGPTPSAGVRL